MVQHDEALPSVDMVIRQLEQGMDFLYEEFGVKQLNVAWQIDPFGHSSISPQLFSSFGFQYFVGNRIDETFREQMKSQQALEFLWSSPPLPPNTTLLAHILPHSYSFPSRLSPKAYDACWYYLHLNPLAWYR